MALYFTYLKYTFADVTSAWKLYHTGTTLFALRYRLKFLILFKLQCVCYNYIRKAKLFFIQLWCKEEVDNMRLLLAEDEQALSKALTAILERNNYSVDAAYNGQEALEYLEADNYDGVILDIMMPKVDGITVLKEIRKKGNLIPVLLLTAKSEVDDKVLGLDAGANDYLTKPFNSRELLARIRAMTRAQTAQANSELQVGNVKLNRATYELSTPSGTYRLANKEFQMMEMLMNNPKHLISSDRFMEKIWGYDSETEINVVWVYISYLRKKLTALHANIQIKVIRNAGYTLEETE